VARSRISQTLRQLRAANGLSYAQVQSNTGLSQQLLYDVEYGDRRLTLDELRLLADCYHVAVNDLLGIDLE
jgi:transcriptional regulator with XRE-family HTH domain